MKCTILSSLLLIFLLSISTVVYSQYIYSDFKFDTVSMYHFELIDGSKFLGNFIEKDSAKVVIKTGSIPRIEIPFDRILEIEILDIRHFKNGQYWFPNPNPTRYLIGPSGFNLKKGEGYYQNIWIFLNSFNVGVTDYFSIGAGVEFISTISAITTGDITPIFFITPKFGFPVSKNFNAGLGILYVNVPAGEDGETSSLAITYGVGTIGNIEHNLTGGLGWGFVDGEFSSRPIITIAGMTRVSRKLSLISENWFIPEGEGGYYPLVSYGMRFMGEKISVDLVFLNNGDIVEAFFLGIPVVDFVVKF